MADFGGMQVHKKGNVSLPIRISLPVDFLRQEVRYGYTVEEKLKKIWAVELDLLKSFTDLCTKYGIHFQVFAGTLLGAVRHKGFIPWDDDVDVCMDRKNFRKLLKLSGAFSDFPYFLQTPLNDLEFYTPYVRFRNSLTTAIICDNKSPSYNNGIYIDVFVMDGLPSGFIRRLHTKIVNWGKRAIMLKLKPINCGNRTVAGRLFSMVEHFVSLRQRIMFHQFALGMMTPFVRRVSMQTHSERFSTKYWLYKHELADTIMMEFEGIRVPVPRAYDLVLKRLYGDYMKFPPESERGKWHEGEVYFNPDMPYSDYFKEGM